MQFLPELRFCMDGTNMEWGGMGGGGQSCPARFPPMEICSEWRDVWCLTVDIHLSKLSNEGFYTFRHLSSEHVCEHHSDARE